TRGPRPPLADSASGVSKHRDFPNLACSPSVTRKTPPWTPTSSPKTKTRSSSAIASASPALIASTMVTAGTGLGLQAFQLSRHEGGLAVQLFRPVREDVVEEEQR